MYATDFEYDGKKLSDFNYIVCNINNVPGVEEVDIGCNITFNTVKNNHSSIHTKTSTSYDELYTDTFQIAKVDCKNNNGITDMTPEDVSIINKWLNKRDYAIYKPLCNDSNIYYYGSFNVKQVMLGNTIIGLTLTFTANAPYGFEDYEIEETLPVNGSVSFDVDSDELNSTIYPAVTIKSFQPEVLPPGLYDDDYNLVATWDELVNNYGLLINEGGYNSASAENQPEYTLTNIIYMNENLQAATNLIVEGSVGYVGAAQLIYNTTIKNIIFQDGVTEIGGYFARSSKIQTVIFLTTSINTINGYVFADCSGLLQIKYGGSESEWKNIIKNSNWRLNSNNVNIFYNYHIGSLVSFYNNSCSNLINIKNCVNNEIIILDGENKIIYTDNDTHKETLSNDFNYEWLTLIVNDGLTNNTIINNGNIEIQIKIRYSSIRKVGV